MNTILKLVLPLGLLVLFAASCKKPSPTDDNAYPKQVTITYRATSASTDKLGSITYDNESGGLTTVNNPPLPFTKSITKTVNKYTVITLGYFVNPAQPVQLEIAINSEVVKSQTYNVPNAALSYSFP